jgi:beta-glucosidase
MKKHLLISLFYIILIVSAIMVLAFASQRTIGSNFHELNSRAQSIVSSLSLREKIGQMLQLDAWSFLRSYPSKDIDMEKLRTYILDYNVGSFLNNMLNITEWIEMITTIQKIAMSSNSRIPVLYGIDSVHGANYVIGATLFPHFGTSACAFRPDLLVKQGEITAKDTRTVGIPWVFSPILEVGANVVWSRVYEVFGEDPYLTTVLGQAIISGLTSNNLQNVTKCAVCMKHFIGYSYPRTGKDHTNSEVSERFLRENLLPPFRGAAKMVQTVMLSMGSINGEPVTSSRRYAKDLLNEIGFEGLVVTDYLAIQQLVDHYKIVNNKREAIKLALNAGVDMAMWVQGTDFSDILYDMVKSGQVPETRIDVSVAKIINLKLQLGLFDNPYPDPNSQYIKTIGSRQDRDVALELARESIVLLKNENNLLPISPTKTKGILATGPSMNSVCLLNGGWSARWEG